MGMPQRCPGSGNRLQTHALCFQAGIDQSILTQAYTHGAGLGFALAFKVEFQRDAIHLRGFRWSAIDP